MIKKLSALSLAAFTAVILLGLSVHVQTTQYANTSFVQEAYADDETNEESGQNAGARKTGVETPKIPKPANVPGANVQGAGALTYFRVFLASAARTVIGLLAFFAIFFIVFAGFLYVTARGDQNQIDKAKKVIMYAIIGLLVASFSYAIVRLVVEVPVKVSQEANR